MSFLPYFVYCVFWTFLCMGGLKNIKKYLSKQSQFVLKKAPTHVRGRFFFF
jgi:hypothetical protein